jgi:hypothetical protein
MTICAAKPCENDVATPRSTLCPRHRLIKAKESGRRGGRTSSGNKEVGKRKRDAGAASSGNKEVGKRKRDAGAIRGNMEVGKTKRDAGAASSGNKEVGKRKRDAGAIRGNMEVGKTKCDAGRRSGLRRCAAMALTVKKEWLDLILAGKKTWEIRGTSTDRRGLIHFAQSGSGQLRGRAKLVGCRQLDRDTFMQHKRFHQIRNVKMVKYKKIWAWILEDAEPHDMPFDYSHKQGAVIFVTVRSHMGPAS